MRNVSACARPHDESCTSYALAAGEGGRFRASEPRGGNFREAVIPRHEPKLYFNFEQGLSRAVCFCAAAATVRVLPQLGRREGERGEGERERERGERAPKMDGAQAGG